jgi:hypothetical protein
MKSNSRVGQPGMFRIVSLAAVCCVLGTARPASSACVSPLGDEASASTQADSTHSGTTSTPSAILPADLAAPLASAESSSHSVAVSNVSSADDSIVNTAVGMGDDFVETGAITPPSVGDLYGLDPRAVALARAHAHAVSVCLAGDVSEVFASPSDETRQAESLTGFAMAEGFTSTTTAPALSRAVEHSANLRVEPVARRRAIPVVAGLIAVAE